MTAPSKNIQISGTSKVTRTGARVDPADSLSSSQGSAGQGFAFVTYADEIPLIVWAVFAICMAPTVGVAAYLLARIAGWL
ncbi:MAG: hypothetical protein QM488_12695 [Rhizobiaceae bacterium]